jgi:diguanylate cyclase (GGDEF)-like protein
MKVTETPRDSFLFDWLKASALVFGFVCLIILRQQTQAFALSLGYLYVALISIAGFWFCVRGGTAAATMASVIFISELKLFPDWFAHDIVLNGLYLRLFTYYFTGIFLGYVSGRIKLSNKRLEKMAYYDELTGCVNYRWIMKVLSKEISRSKRYSKPMSLVMIDIDHFKKLNDQYGHITCNRVLKAFADLLISSLRDLDTVGRYGGEEFLIILPEAEQDKALSIMQRIKEKLPEIKVKIQNSKEAHNIPFTFSAGISSYPYNGSNYSELISSADDALYRSKESGRDKMSVEKRRWVRFKPVPGLSINIIDLSSKEKIDNVKIKDISQKGMFLIIPKDIKSDSLLCMLNFKHLSRAFNFKCKVARKIKNADSTHMLGVYYLDLPKEAEESLRNCLTR